MKIVHLRNELLDCLSTEINKFNKLNTKGNVFEFSTPTDEKTFVSYGNILATMFLDKASNRVKFRIGYKDKPEAPKDTYEFEMLNQYTQKPMYWVNTELSIQPDVTPSNKLVYRFLRTIKQKDGQ